MSTLTAVDPSELRPGDEVLIWSTKYGGPFDGDAIATTKPSQFVGVDGDTAYFNEDEKIGVSLLPTHGYEFYRVTEDEPESEPFRGSRLVQFEVPDVRAEDLITIALQRFNEEFPDEPVRYRHLGSMIIGNPKEFS